MDNENEKEPPSFKRILIKLSGEALAGQDKVGINTDTIKRIANDVVDVYRLGIEVAIVIGGGNIFRGETGKALGLDRITGDYMGMLATVINSLAFQDVLEKIGLPTRVMTSIEMHTVAEPYIRRRAIRHLEKGRIVLLSGGSGNPLFTTDTAAGLRAIEIEADILMKATRVDGIYDSDPEKVKDAEKIESISYIDVIQRKLKIMDLTAISLCMDNSMPIVVFNLFQKNSIYRIVKGEKIGTMVS
ncbi:MAG: UMP kinase [Spirochaetota bacterium]|nr:UMP kinase [Spirochaetota bacterium]